MNFFFFFLNNNLALMEVCSSLWYLYWRRENLDTTWFIWQGDATLTQMGSRGSWLKLTAASSDLILFLRQECIECNTDIKINGNVMTLTKAWYRVLNIFPITSRSEQKYWRFLDYKVINQTCSTTDVSKWLFKQTLLFFLWLPISLTLRICKKTNAEPFIIVNCW